MTDVEFQIIRTNKPNIITRIAADRDYSYGIKVRMATLYAIEHKLDLTGSNLSEGEFYQFDFSGAILDDVDFSGSDMRGAKFTGCSMSGTIIDYCDLKKSDISWDQLNDCNLEKIKAQLLINVMKMPEILSFLIWKIKLVERLNFEYKENAFQQMVCEALGRRYDMDSKYRLPMGLYFNCESKAEIFFDSLYGNPNICRKIIEFLNYGISLSGMGWHLALFDLDGNQKNHAYDYFNGKKDVLRKVVK